jgi:hypothetical protein
MADRAGAAASECDTNCMTAADGIATTESSSDIHMHTKSLRLKHSSTTVSMHNDAVRCESRASDSSSAGNSNGSSNGNNSSEHCAVMLDASTCTPLEAATAGTEASVEREVDQLLTTLAAASKPQPSCAGISDSSTACARSGDSDCEGDYVEYTAEQAAADSIATT